MITLRLADRSAQFVGADDAPGAPLALGPALLQERWRHDLPTALELEAAIEAVENLVMPLQGRWARGATLHVQGTPVAGLAALAGDTLSPAALEDLFNRAVAIALGRPASSDPALASGRAIATLLILRETMHHLGFAQLVLRAGAAP